ncbi:MAG: hypothetical protein EOM80_11860 [Erysipelotrichia bacterium]|nr:hypothetical protein [Erysipelotrichia bacterium]
MKRIGFLLLSFLLLFSPCFAQEPEDSGVRFSDLYGEVSVRPNAEDDDAYEYAELDMILKVNDRIRTKEESGAILSLTDMSTFVVKPESIIVLSAPTGKESKIQLLAGNIWVNVKKMVADGTMEVEMSQAVAGIKGTNITCSTNREGTEDRIQVLRGHAEVLIRESKEKVEVREGEELIVKTGGKTEKVEIDVGAQQKLWEDATSRMGEAIQLDEVPEILKGILDAESSEFARLNEIFMRLMALESVEAAEALELQRDAERFVGVLLEDAMILGSTRRKIDTALQTPGITAEERVRLASLMKNIAAVVARQQTYQAEITKIMRYEFKLSALIEELGAELEMLRTELAQAVADVDAVKAVLSANPTGQSQDWFMDASEVCALALSALDELSVKTSDLLTANPTSVELQAMVKQISDQRNSIATMIKSLSIVEIDSSTIIEMSQIEDLLSNQMVVLQAEISAYNTISGYDEGERRLKSSLQIMNSYAKVRRLYVNAQRLYETTMKATSASAYRTSEQEELENTWQNISDTFQQLGIVADELQSNIQDLESQLSTFLK